ncbi:ficolin-1-A-like [Anopheles ziemanni]|uniref:ficolin-1-A-like n=1 Tax=Anopheles coustani TaxID=139045 RepID=UPI002658C3AA|nr:ficolin-1-A-like [Anopheles coustani]XP_058178591.1 ficolin-1-A-like [Anopheles ziemanni]
MKLIVLVLAVSCMASFGAAETAPKYGAKPPPYKPSVPDVPAPGGSDIDKCGCHQIVGKLKKVESNLLKLILNLRNKYGAVYSELLDMKKQVKGVTWYVGQTAATSQSINDQLSIASSNLAQIMYSIRELTINQQSLVTKTFLTESILDLEGRQGESGGVTPPAPEGDIIYTSCDDPRITETGTYLVQDSFDVPTKLICVLEFGPGAYTVVQNRQDGSTDFYRGYNDYKAGFGEFDGGDYWLGLDRIHNITASGDYELFVLLEDFEKNISYARYDSFAIGSGSDFYPILKLEGFSGPAGDSFGVVGGVLFSTYDLDLDNSESNCAVTNRGGWWYTECGDSNLNGLYLKGLTGGTTGMSWSTFRGANYSLKKSRMMVKRKVPVEPPTTLPPVTDGPTTVPPATDTPATDPPATDPPTTPPVTPV